MTQTLTRHEESITALESALIGGDLAKLGPADRVHYYNNVCRSLDLNPLTRPFEYITLSGKLTLYARRDATDQLRAKQGISVEITSREMLDEQGLYVVTAAATAKDGRVDSSIGAVSIANLKGEALANALMKAETKAKRRATLSICGLGWMDESESGDFGTPVDVDSDTGEIRGPARPATEVREELRAAMAEFGVEAAAIHVLVGGGRTSHIEAWLRDHPDSSVRDLVRLAGGIVE